MVTLLVVLTLIVAFANGANDVSKGVATLVGSGVTNLPRALFWGTAWTVAGGVAAAFLSQGLVSVFSGKGLLATTPGPAFLVGVAVGAIGWLVIATWTGLPVSTTHSLVGGLVGVGVAAEGVAGVRWAAVAAKVAVPLAVSPLIALALMMASYPLIGFAFRRLNRYCVCVEREEPLAFGAGSAAVLTATTGVRVIAGADCPSAVVARMNAMDSLHWLTAGATSFSRGLNDTPKILALGVMMASYPLIGFAFRRLNRYCVCVEREEPVVLGAGPAAVLGGTTAVRVIAGADCPSAVVARVNAMDSLHWLTSGATSFFRGLNDTPKILALGVLAAAATGIATEWFFLLVALAIGAGSYVSGRRVTETLAGKITTIRHDDGFAANLVTSALVGIASFHALPVSTTHVSSGAILGIGARKAEVRWRMAREMVAAWVVTVPVAGMVAAVAYLAIGRLG